MAQGEGGGRLSEFDKTGPQCQSKVTQMTSHRDQEQPLLEWPILALWGFLRAFYTRRL
jgi:hypothetical protein